MKLVNIPDLVLNSLGAGSGGDVIFLFFEDIVGETKNIKMPRHAKSWGDGNKILNKLNQERSKAINAFKTDVQNSNYPNSEHTISMDDGELDKLINELKRMSTIIKRFFYYLVSQIIWQTLGFKTI